MNPQAPKKITYKYSPIWVGLCLLLLVGVFALAYYFYTTSVENADRKQTLISSNEKTNKATAAIATTYSDQKFKQTREEAGIVREGMLESYDADTMINSLRPMWALISRNEEANAEFIHRRYQITRGSSPVSAWYDLQALLEKFNGMAAVAVDSVDIQTVGDNRKREFSRITLNISVYVRKS